MNRRITVIVCAMLLGVTLNIAQARVSIEEAARLKGDLTSVGAEIAGNADGSIPKYTGGLEPPADYKEGDWLVDPFADEKPLFTITPKNYEKYADKLAASQIEMFKRVPHFKMDVYPTHRTVSYPDWIKENTYNNALNAELVDNGNGVEGACGGIPFPIPKSGGEVIQNFLLRYWGSNISVESISVSGYRNAKGIECTGAKAVISFPYYQKGQPCDDRLMLLANFYTKPARRKGEQLIVNDFLNANKRPREAWQYIPGQRRVRRAPTIGFDTPDTATVTYDDAYMYNGSPERYDWKFIGKKEIYIPYNGYTLESAWAKKKMTLKNITPKYPTSNLVFRWELHRVWVVEATLKKGMRHIYAKRIFYIDEDSWSNAIQDRYDAKGKLWRYSWGNIVYYYGKGDQFTEIRPMLQKDLQSGEYYFAYMDLRPLRNVERPAKNYYAPSGLRRRARR